MALNTPCIDENDLSHRNQYRKVNANHVLFNPLLTASSRTNYRPQRRNRLIPIVELLDQQEKTPINEIGRFPPHEGYKVFKMQLMTDPA